MSELVLVINAGSSSIKFSLFETSKTDPVVLFKGQMEGLYVEPKFSAKDAADQKVANETLPSDAPKSHDYALRYMLDWLQSRMNGRSIAVIGHRVVHGGTQYSKPVLVNAEVIVGLEALIPLAPLHEPHNITPIKILQELLPNVPQVACFDTAFHTTQPELNQLFALPYEFAQKENIRRYGFHGLSYEYIASVLPEIDTRAAEGRTVVAHLGNGSSMAGLLGGVCQATTMGFTALDGLPMGTRCGRIDGGVILHLLNHLKMDAKQIETLLYKESGLLGLSGISSDMRDLQESDSPRAQMAVQYFANSVVREAAGLAATLGGMDALVFTAGIGENDAHTRQEVCHQLRWLGVDLDEAANAARSSEPRRISLDDSKIAVYVIPTNEELMIARQALACLA